MFLEASSIKLLPNHSSDGNRDKKNDQMSHPQYASLRNLPATLTSSLSLSLSWLMLPEIKAMVESFSDAIVSEITFQVRAASILTRFLVL
jgi:hypothetical protein